MKLFLYAITDGDNVINKTLPTPVEIDIQLRNDVDVISPQINLRNIVGINYDDFNYAYIDVLDRYYFIDKLGRVNISDNILYLSCDVLETYKTEILLSNARLKRNIKNGDYIDVNVENSIVQSVMLYNSDKGLVDGESTKIFITIGD
jgi:hypothetical protein